MARYRVLITVQTLEGERKISCDVETTIHDYRQGQTLYVSCPSKNYEGLVRVTHAPSPMGGAYIAELRCEPVVAYY